MINDRCNVSGGRGRQSWSQNIGGTRRLRVYRRLALAHLGADNLISEHAIVRAHDRCQPLLIKMFASSNFGKRSFNVTETKVILIYG